MSERENFEEVASRLGFNLTMAEHETGEYHYQVTQDAWDIWQEVTYAAAREQEGGEAVVVKDAYDGAREDLQIWKKRALESEKLLQEEIESNARLVEVCNDLTGPTHMGEPVLPPRQGAQEAKPIAYTNGSQLFYLWDEEGEGKMFAEREGDYDIALYTHPAQSQGVPEGYVLAPKSMCITQEDVGLIVMMTGWDDEDQDDAEGVLWFGLIEDDEGNRTHGLNISCSECMEEGAIQLVQFDEPNSTPAAPQVDEWVKCSQRLPRIGQRVILRSKGVVQNYMPTLDQGDIDGFGGGDGYFWCFDDAIGDEDYPLVDFETDEWMPCPQPPEQGDGV